MKFSTVFVLLALLVIGVAGGSKKRLIRLEKSLQDLTAEVSELKARANEIQLAKRTLEALEMESRALALFDRQLMSLKESLDQLAHHKDRHTDSVQSFRQQLDQIRNQVDAAKQMGTGLASSDNAVKTIQWLAQSFGELKSDLERINSNLNLSGELQQAEDTQKKMNFIQEEVRQLRRQYTEESAERQRLAAELAQMRSDLNESAESHQRCLKDLGQMTVEMQSLKSDSSGGKRSQGRYSQHHQLEQLKSSLRSMKDKQQDLEATVGQLQSSGRLLAGQCEQLTSKVEVNGAVIGKLEASHNTLHENIELMAEQNDFQAQEVLKAVDRLYVNMTQVQARCDRALLHQDVIDDKLTRIAADVELMEGEMEKDRIAVLMLQTKTVNDTLQRCKDETWEHIFNVRMSDVQQQIQTLQSNMDTLMSSSAGSESSPFNSDSSEAEADE